MGDRHITELYHAWRAASLGDREIVEGIVAPEHAADAAGTEEALARWDAAEGGVHYWDAFAERPWLVLVREQSVPRERWWLHALLFALTLLTTTIYGAAMAGVGVAVAWPRLDLAAFRAGTAFSLPLAAILLAHESGHFVAARRYKMNVSPPFFIPYPPLATWSNLIGTLGAFIRIRSPVFDRRTLFDVGVAGPLAGLLVAVPVLFVGLALSTARAVPAMPMGHQFVMLGSSPLYLGDSLLLLAARAALGLSGTLELHPVAVAGWVGLLVTAINLIPLAQFDGGHIAYAMSARVQRVASWYVMAALLAMGMLWGGWWVWATLALLVGRGRLTHPDVLSPLRPLDDRRMSLGWVALALFVLTLAPVPVAG